MSDLLPSTVIRQAYIRIGAWLGLPEDIAFSYNNDTAFTNVISESFPPQSMQDYLVGVEQEMALAIALNQDNVLRSNISDTVTVASGAQIPSHGSSSTTAKIIGNWGQVRDAADENKLLVPALREEEIRIIMDNSGVFISSYFAYALRPPRIYATVANVIIDCCVFDYDARKAAIDADEPLLFPMAQNAYFSGLMCSLKNEDATITALSSQFEKPYAEWLGAQQANRPVTVEAAA